ncbi:alkane hydroxylase MAH1-like [Mangifera indica]|uniref:alkane hydroxylase MAH1-like n=1 Tax=Mangifera indica TaxID=29780 RepID=UPI001CF99CD9|nr:alkane hydroxylase MAH1-like [Mangifera indica]
MPLLVAYLQCMILVFIFFLVINFYRKRNKLVLRHLPIFGILPEVLFDFHLFHDKLSKILRTRKGTILINYWLSPYNILITSDPANVHYMLTTNFSRYPKGSEWRKRFDVFGRGLFNSDFEEWTLQRKAARGFFTHTKFHQLTAKIVPEIIEKGVIPVLEYACKNNLQVDLQDLLKRYAFDYATIIATGCNPKSLSVGMPEIPFSKAFADAGEAIFFRHFVPETLWKLQRWLRIGKERKYRDGWRVINEFYQNLLVKQDEPRKDEESFNVLNLYLNRNAIVLPRDNDEEIMRDNVISIIFAGEDTTSTALTWFFWLVSQNPKAISIIREEIKLNATPKDANKGDEDRPRLFNFDELSNLVYLHAALCESLRLFPSIPYETRTPTQQDQLPSGHRVNEKTFVIICAYAMGRMETVWGEDCYEFKPERWITDDGGIKHEPSHKFFAFSTRPRMCLGKEIAFVIMKAIAAAIIYNYDIQVLENPPVIPSLSISLRMKHGLMVKINRKSY